MRYDLERLTQGDEYPLTELEEVVESICGLLNSAVSIMENPHHWQLVTTAVYAAGLLDDVPGMADLLGKLKRMQSELGGAFTPAMKEQLEVERQAEAQREELLKALAN